MAREEVSRRQTNVHQISFSCLFLHAWCFIACDNLQVSVWFAKAWVIQGLKTLLRQCMPSWSRAFKEISDLCDLQDKATTSRLQFSVLLCFSLACVSAHSLQMSGKGACADKLKEWVAECQDLSRRLPSARAYTIVKKRLHKAGQWNCNQPG